MFVEIIRKILRHAVTMTVTELIFGIYYHYIKAQIFRLNSLGITHHINGAH